MTLHRAILVAVLLLVVVVAGAGCSDAPGYTGSGTDGALVGATVEDGSTCGVTPRSGYGACVQGRPVRVVWRDGEQFVVDAACFSDRVNVAVDSDVVVASFPDAC